MQDKLVTLLKQVFFALGLVVAVLVLFRLMDVALATTLYSHFFQAIRDVSGFPDLLSGALAIWLVAAVLLISPTIIWSILTKKRTAILLIALLLSTWWVALYILSQPRKGYFFNPITGSPRFKYARIPNGSLELFPLGYNYHPRYNTKLEDLTTEIVIEYEGQQTSPAHGSLPRQPAKTPALAVLPPPDPTTQRLRVAANPEWLHAKEDHLELKVESVGLADDKTVLRSAVRCTSESDGDLVNRGNGAYIIDGNGTRYDLRDVNAPGADSDLWLRYVRRNEVYRYEMHFPLLLYKSPFIYLEHPQFGSMKVTLHW